MLACYHEVILHMTQKKVKAKKLSIGNIYREKGDRMQ